MLASRFFAKMVPLMASLVTTLASLSGQAQTVNITSAEIAYNIFGTYTPSGAPVENINHSGTINLLSQPSFEFSTSPWGGDMRVDFDLLNVSSSGFGYSFLGNAIFGMSNPASFNVAAETNYSYSILFELDSAAWLDLGLAYSGFTVPTAYSPLSPGRDASYMFEYLGLNGWETVATHNGTTGGGTPAVDYYQIVDAGTYRISGTGLSHAAIHNANGSVQVAPPVPVPEPAGIVLAGLAGIVLIIPRRRF